MRLAMSATNCPCSIMPLLSGSKSMSLKVQQQQCLSASAAAALAPHSTSDEQAHTTVRVPLLHSMPLQVQSGTEAFHPIRRVDLTAVFQLVMAAF